MTYAWIPLYFSFLKKRATFILLRANKVLRLQYSGLSSSEIWTAIMLTKTIWSSGVWSSVQRICMTAWLLHISCEWKIVVEIRVEEAQENWTSCWLQSYHLYMWLWAVVVLSKPLACATYFFFLFKVLLCQCSCYVAEDQQFQWLEKVKLARQQIEQWSLRGGDLQLSVSASSSLMF